MLIRDEDIIDDGNNVFTPVSSDELFNNDKETDMKTDDWFPGKEEV